MLNALPASDDPVCVFVKSGMSGNTALDTTCHICLVVLICVWFAPVVGDHHATHTVEPKPAGFMLLQRGLLPQ